VCSVHVCRCVCVWVCVQCVCVQCVCVQCVCVGGCVGVGGASKPPSCLLRFWFPTMKPSVQFEILYCEMSTRPTNASLIHCIDA
jgi:hypothetical protein